VPGGRDAALARFGARFFADLDAGRSADPVLKAVVDTVQLYGIDREAFSRFLRSMAMDLDRSTYATFDDLLDYMDGSAAVIGELMLPILGPSNVEVARGPARDLGVAFQLTNFWRDVVEDLDRGRVYLPQEDLERFDARAPLDERRVTPEWVELMRFEVDRTRALYRSADAGLGYLPPRSRRCVAAARQLYSEILDRIEGAGYDVFARRLRVPTWRKAAVAARHLR
jgi:phytoene synthase